MKAGFLQPVIKGWYISARPGEAAGESTSWYASFWTFCAAYLNHRFGEQWCLSPEQSLLLHAENWSVPKQLLVRSPNAVNKIIQLKDDTSILDIIAAIPVSAQTIQKSQMRIYSIPAALCEVPASFYTQYPLESRTALAQIRNASEILPRLLDEGKTYVAGRLAGAFRNTGAIRIADDIRSAMVAAGHAVQESDPFQSTLLPLAHLAGSSPYVTRIALMWRTMRDKIPSYFPPSGNIKNNRKYLARIDAIYVTDAYHSLSIEGYRVSEELIEKVRRGDWNPEINDKDKEHVSALAARGYWQAFQQVKESIEKILGGESPGRVIDADHAAWYRELFGPSVRAGILKASDLAGYRNHQVYIRNARHIPPNVEAVRDAMPAFLEMLQKEELPQVRIVLGHFIFAFIHPYMDGNGRMARFLMNAMMAAAGYPWTVIPVEDRDVYMQALDSASFHQDIRPFAKYLGNKVVQAIKTGV